MTLPNRIEGGGERGVEEEGRRVLMSHCGMFSSASINLDCTDASLDPFVRACVSVPYDLLIYISYAVSEESVAHMTPAKNEITSLRASFVW